ncbi:MAG: aldose 1-epimerase family protein [Acidimicrobiales bacterium]
MTSPTPASPSGQQFEIGHGQEHVVVTEIGATLRSYTVGGTAVVEGFDASEMCTSARGQVLAPWPNRLGDGRYSFAGRAGQAALDEPERHNAIHGLLRWVPWWLESRAQNVLTMRCTLHPQPGYPWRLGLAVEYRLGRGGLVVTTEATNLDDSPAPFGIGFHPYLTLGTPTIDTARLRIPARNFLRSDERGLPAGDAPVHGSEYDFTVSRPVGPTRLDTAFCGLDRDAHGVARVELVHPDDGRRVALWMDGGFSYVMAYTGDTLQPAGRRRLSIAVEPMSCPPDALRSGIGLVELAPGVTWRGAWGISAR